MFSIRPAVRAIARSTHGLGGANRSVVTVKKGLIKAGEVDAPEDVPAVEVKMEKMAEKDATMVYESGAVVLDPVLPENPAEVSELDPAHRRSQKMPDGRTRMVTIKQLRARPNQSPLNAEKVWKISFNDDGAVGERWTNPLMGWNSTADTMGCDTPLHFSNAADAVYFAKKRGWKYLVHEPIIRTLRNDDAQYQDNFLPQAIANAVQREGAQCAQWERKEAGTSHYFRPLKYHGNGTVRQHGPNALQKPAKDVASYYKLR
mmetsp:Transcript_1916/g.4721  ORF Transcript_1916/g.4721 Transcript_1916/m.4721 type:complete len:260 (-) Transcript_1916:302-1081(-)|eukprot:CAMPEP_0119561782 /NCGR_PEP_ID=MMETSP1352-20130426/18601_1 /TAXON_ID=265584 /ORGANISM="Stauroneis constricta, Strain CCMP1120" /LENGTH=259 /DNA_ID=CAMNT_0007610063 /DNA_START=92 /DNA_END=871 /DNA_ORIENTATION=-